jgi:hypothetical protein
VAAPSVEVQRAQNVYRKIMEKGSMINAGRDSSEDEDDKSKSSDDSEDHNVLDIGLSQFEGTQSTSCSTSQYAGNVSSSEGVIEDVQPKKKQKTRGDEDLLSPSSLSEKSKNSRNSKRGNLASSMVAVAETLVSRLEVTKQQHELKLQELRLVREEMQDQRQAEKEERRLEREEAARRFELQREETRQALQVIALTIANAFKNKN